MLAPSPLFLPLLQGAAVPAGDGEPEKPAGSVRLQIQAEVLAAKFEDSGEELEDSAAVSGA